MYLLMSSLIKKEHKNLTKYNYKWIEKLTVDSGLIAKTKLFSASETLYLKIHNNFALI